jgi:hypothetical protein
VDLLDQRFRSASFPSFSSDHAFLDLCDLLMRAPFKSTIMIDFSFQALEFQLSTPAFFAVACPPQIDSPSRFRTSKISTLNFSEMILSEARELVTCVSQRSTTAIALGLQTLKNSTFNFHFPSKCMDFCRVSS